MSLLFIVNTRSGRAAQALAEVRDFASRCGAELALTTHRAHATELARDAVAKGIETVVAVGGDGTMNEVATALVGSEATLGLVPCGSGDGLGRHLGIHGSVARALHLLEARHVRRIDAGTANGRYFFTAAGLGFEAEIACRFNALQHRGFGRYLTTAGRAWREWPCQRFTIEYPGGRDEVTAFTLAVANANQYGNNAYIAPAARVDDGALDLTAVPPVTVMSSLPLIIRLFSRTLGGATGVLRRSAPRFLVTSDTPTRLHTDGEVHDAVTAVEFVVRPGSLKIIAP